MPPDCLVVLFYFVLLPDGRACYNESMETIFKYTTGDVVEVPTTGVLTIKTHSHSLIILDMETTLGSFTLEGESDSEMFKLVRISDPIVIGEPVQLWVTVGEDSDQVGMIETSPVIRVRVVFN